MAKVITARQKLQNPRTLLLMVVIGLLLTYALATRAIDTGSLGQYGLTFLFFIVTINLSIKAIHAIRNGNKG